MTTTSGGFTHRLRASQTSPSPVFDVPAKTAFDVVEEVEVSAVIAASAKKDAWTDAEAQSQDVNAGGALSFDPDFKGPKPLEQRKFHNIAAGVMLVVILMGMFGIFGYAIAEGDYRLILYGAQTDGSRCGIDHASYKYLLWTDPVSSPGTKRCVSRCPSMNSEAAAVDGSVTVTWNTRVVLNRCLPVSCNSSWSSGDCASAKQLVLDDYPSRPVRFVVDCASLDGFIGMAAGLGAGVLLDLVLSLRIQHFGKLQVKILYFVTLFIIMVFAGIVLLNTGNVGTSGISMSFDQDDSFSFLTLFFGLVVLVLWLAMLLLGCYLNKNLDLVEFVMREISVPLAAIPRGGWIPLLPAAVLTFFSACWIFSTILLLSFSNSFICFVLCGYELLAVLLCFEFMRGLTSVMVAGAVGTWYWSTHTELKVVQEGGVCRSLRRSFPIGLGVLSRAAFAFFIFRPVLKFLRSVHRAAHPIRNDPGCPACANSCCCLCLPLAECTKMMDDRVYIQVAIHGSSWGESLTASFDLFHRSRDTAEFATSVMDKMLFVSSMASAALAGAVTFWFLANNGNIYCPTGPAIIVCCIALGNSNNFGLMYQCTIDTVMESFCEDKERNDGSFMRKYHMTAGLKQLFLKELEQAAEPLSPATGPDDVLPIEALDDSPRAGHHRSRMNQAEIEEIEDLNLYYNPVSPKGAS